MPAKRRIAHPQTGVMADHPRLQHHACLEPPGRGQNIGAPQTLRHPTGGNHPAPDSTSIRSASCATSPTEWVTWITGRPKARGRRAISGKSPPSPSGQARPEAHQATAPPARSGAPAQWRPAGALRLTGWPVAAPSAARCAAPRSHPHPGSQRPHPVPDARRNAGCPQRSDARTAAYPARQTRHPAGAVQQSGAHLPDRPAESHHALCLWFETGDHAQKVLLPAPLRPNRAVIPPAANSWATAIPNPGRARRISTDSPVIAPAPERPETGG